MKISQSFNVTEGSWASLINLLRTIYTALTTNLTLGDNIIGGYQTVTFTTSTNYTGGHFNPIVLPWAFASKKQPQSVIIAQLISPSNQSPLLSTATCHNWTYDTVRQQINISYISGLNNNSKYTITFEVK